MGFLRRLLGEIFGAETNPLIEALRGCDSFGKADYFVRTLDVDERGIFAELEMSGTGQRIKFRDLASDSPSQDMERLVNDARGQGFSIQYDPQGIAQRYIIMSRVDSKHPDGTIEYSHDRTNHWVNTQMALRRQAERELNANQIKNQNCAKLA